MGPHDAVATITGATDQEAVGEALAFGDPSGSAATADARSHDRVALRSGFAGSAGRQAGVLEPNLRLAGPVEDSRQHAPRKPKPAQRRHGAAAFHTWSRHYTIRLMLFDVLVGMLAVVGAAVLFPHIISFSSAKLAVLISGAGLAWPMAIAASRGYERSTIGVGSDEMRAIFRGGVLAIAAGAVPSAITDRYGVVALCVMSVPLAGLASLAVRFAARRLLHRQQRLGRNVRRVIVAGSANSAAELNAVLTREPHCGMTVVGACVPQADMRIARDAGLEVVGDLDQVPELVKDYQADAVAVTGGDSARQNYLRELSWSLEGVAVELLVHPGLVEVAGPRMHIRPFVGLPLLHVEQPHFVGWRRFAKRATDIALTTVGLVVISPIMALIALAVKLADGGPVLFRQTRVGLDGSTFTMLKFRSMHTNAESRLAQLRAQNPNVGLMFKLDKDPRVTRVGRFLRRYSLDELPQLFNILGGSMSLVGPRPPLQSEVAVYGDHARRRLLVTPGLTGLWQVSGRSLLSWEETVRLDLRYVENWNLTLDLLIIWKTIFAVLAKRGAF
jgi:exopolysaccharide biosynthesis polyprenyl glycosylphosphotransferase